MAKSNEASDIDESEPNESNNKTLDIRKIDDPVAKVESTRSRIAITYVICFFVTIFFAFFIGIYKCFSVNEYKDMLISISGILSGPLGFIIGYYFKSSEKVNS